MRNVVSSIVEVIGAAAVTVGAGMAWLPAGLIVGGSLLIVFGFQAGDS